MMHQNKVSSRNIQVLQMLKNEAEEDITHLWQIIMNKNYILLQLLNIIKV